MKRLWIAALIILMLAGLAGLHVSHLQTFTDELISQVKQAENSLDQKNWPAAKETVQAIYDQWEGQAFYLHTMLRHTEIDEIRTSIREVLAYLDSKEDTAECRAAAAKLINQLELLVEAELPSIKNLL